MAKWIVPVGKASGGLAIGALVAVVGVGACRSQDTAQMEPATGPYEAPVEVDTAGLPGPVQPILYRHDIHAGQYEIDCKYCHYAAEVSASPGLPTVASCMGCHLIIGRDNPEVQKLLDAQANNQPIEWTEVHRLSQFVHFPHNRHVVNGELECQECHGQIERMPQVYQFASLKMGWCVSCHEESTYVDEPERTVTTDCTSCHY